jgi:Zn-dependent metalloprotease
MTKIVIILCSLLCILDSFSQSQSNTINFHSKFEYQEYILNKETGLPKYITFKNRTSFTEDNIKRWYSSLFHSSNLLDYKFLSSHKDDIGYTHYRYQQYYQQYPIQHSEFIIHVKDNEIKSINGNLYPEPKIQSEPTLPAETCILKNKLNNVNCNQKNKNELTILYTEEDPILAWKIQIYCSSPIENKIYYIHSNTCKIEKQENQIHSIQSKGKANTIYSGEQEIITDSTNLGFVLRDYSRGEGIITLNNKKNTDTTSSVDFMDRDNYWDTTNIELDQYAVDAHWGTEKTYDYFLKNHNRNSIDNNGYRLVNILHYGSNFVNAFWDGYKMIYGDGNSSVGPLVSLDIIGHEITHGITANTAKLVSENESGALNESFSDIFGATIDWYSRPNKANWTVGEEVSSSIRSLEDPSINNDPKFYKGKNWKPLYGSDFGGIHSNNGVQNFWYYIIVNGIDETNEKGNHVQISGIGIDKSAKIVYRSLTTYLTSLSTYEDARYYSIKAAEDLFGYCSTEVECVANAWYFVGVGKSYTNKIKADFESITYPSCVNSTITFQNNSNNSKEYIWDFGDGTSSTDRNPKKTYNQPGIYTVQLLVKGDSICGLKDSIEKNNHILIEPVLPNKNEIITICSSDSLQLIASNKNCSTLWYTSLEDKNPIDTTNIKYLNNLTKDSVLYYETNLYNVGNKNLTSYIGSYQFDVRYQIFDVYTPIKLKTITVNAFSSGNRTIELRTRTGNILQSKTINIPSGISKLNLDFEIMPGQDYQLGVKGNNINLGRSNGGINYPYTIDSIISIKASNASNAGLSYYYFFYDWEIQINDCVNRKSFEIKLEDSLSNFCSENTTKLIPLKSLTSAYKVAPNPFINKIEIINFDSQIEFIELRDNLGKKINIKLIGNYIYIDEISTGIYSLIITKKDKTSQIVKISKL